MKGGCANRLNTLRSTALKDLMACVGGGGRARYSAETAAMLFREGDGREAAPNRGGTTVTTVLC